MFAMPAPVQDVLVLFAPVFSSPVWNHARLLLLGAIPAPGKQTMTSALHGSGQTQERRFTNCQRVLDRAAWQAWFAAKILLGLLSAILPGEGPLLVLADETIGRDQRFSHPPPRGCSKVWRRLRAAWRRPRSQPALIPQLEAAATMWSER